MTHRPFIALTGAGGDLGARITEALVARGATVRALVRTGLTQAERAHVSRRSARQRSLPILARCAKWLTPAEARSASSRR
jgi:uncharacterized protein YbjT (DUF2867 family)